MKLSSADGVDADCCGVGGLLSLFLIVALVSVVLVVVSLSRLLLVPLPLACSSCFMAKDFI